MASGDAGQRRHGGEALVAGGGSCQMLADPLDGLADGLVVGPSERVAGALAPIVRRTVRLLDRDGLLASRLTALAGDLERGRVAGSHGSAPPAVPVPGSQTLGAADPALGTGLRSYGNPDRHVRVVIRSLPGAAAEAAVTAQRTGTDQVEVRVGGWAERRHGLWARAFDADDGTLVALGPLRRDGRDAVAPMLVPPRAIGRVEVDITDRSEMPRPRPR